MRLEGVLGKGEKSGYCHHAFGTLIMYANRVSSLIMPVNSRNAPTPTLKADSMYAQEKKKKKPWLYQHMRSPILRSE
jgi:hypothetical protein